MKKINNILISLSSAIVCSCTTLGNEKTKSLYSENIVKQSIEDVTTKYGYYSSEWKDSDGNQIYQYLYKDAHYTSLVYIPIAAYFGSILTDNYEVILTYNKNGQLVNKKNFYNKIKSSTGLTCGGCIKKVYNDTPQP